MFGRIGSAAGNFFAARRRALRWVVAAGVLVAALLAAVAALPLFLNGEAAKAAIERQLTLLIGGDFRYATLDLEVWPTPTAKLRQVTFHVASVADGAAERAEVRVSFWRLLVGDVRVATIRLERPTLVLWLPATDTALFRDDPVASYRSAAGPALEWLALHARGLALSVRDGTIDLDVPGGPPLKFDGVTLDGRVSSDAVEMKVAAHGNLWRAARGHARFETDSLAGNLELEIDGLEVESALERRFAVSTVIVHPAATDATLTARTDGQRSATAQLTVTTPAFAISRKGARLDIGASRVRLEANTSPGESTVRLEELKLGDFLSSATGSLRVRPGAGGTVLEATVGRMDAGRVRTGALALADDLSLVRGVAAIVRGGTALDLRVAAAGDDVKILADPSAYDVSMAVEGASIDVPVPAVTLTRASGSVHIARDVLTARGVAATFGGSSLKSGELVLALTPVVALRSLAMNLDLDLAENHARVLQLLRDSPLGTELGRVESIAGRAKGTLSLAGEGGGLRQIYDVTSLNSTLRHTGAPLAIAIDSGGVHYETGGALVLRNIAGAVGASRVQQLDAQIGFGSGPIVRAASGSAVLALDDLYAWAIVLPGARILRDELAALEGTAGLKLTRLAGPLNAPERLDMDAVFTPTKVRAKSRHLPGRLTIDGGSVRVENRDLLFEGVAIAMQDTRGTLSGSFRGYAGPSPALDLSIARGTIGPRGLEWAQNEAGLARGARLQAPIKLDRARVRWPGPAPWQFDVTAAASFPGGARSEVDLSYRPGSVEVRQLTLKDQDSDSRIALDWQPERASVAFHGFVSGRSIARILAAPPAATGTLRGDFDATVDLAEPVRSRATGKLQGADVDLPGVFDWPLAIDRIALEADGDRVHVHDTVLRLAGEPLTIAASITRESDGLVFDGDIGAEGIDAGRWLDRLRSRPAADDASPWRWPLRGRFAVRARHVGVLGYRVEPFVAAVAFGDRKLTTDVTDARLCGIPVRFNVTATEKALDVKGRADAQDLPVAAAIACISKDTFRASGTMDLSAEFAANGTPASLPASVRGSARVRARDGRIGGVGTLSGVLKLEEVSERLPSAELESAREGVPYLAIEIDARVLGERAFIDRALLESGMLSIAVQGEIGLGDSKVALTGIALPIVNVNALLRRVPIVGRIVGQPIVGIPFSVSGELADPKVAKVGAAAIAGALLSTLQSVVTLPV
ncbi:MAG: hypothetical protein ABWZ29_08095, partial [Casimicrobiaceae bacterium]